MVLCIKELGGYGVSRAFSSLDKTMYHHTFIFCTSKWRAREIFSEKEGTVARVLTIPLSFCIVQNVLSLKNDKAMEEKKFRHHSRCKSLSLTHLCFTDDLMMFVERTKESIEGALICSKLGNDYSIGLKGYELAKREN